jgi:hypothetical protein
MIPMSRVVGLSLACPKALILVYYLECRTEQPPSLVHDVLLHAHLVLCSIDSVFQQKLAALMAAQL